MESQLSRRSYKRSEFITKTGVHVCTVSSNVHTLCKLFNYEEAYYFFIFPIHLIQQKQNAHFNVH
jgi:hypothetical protein